jgi:hypothetical protein
MPDEVGASMELLMAFEPDQDSPFAFDPSGLFPDV